MLLALSFFLLIVCAGFVPVRLLGLLADPRALGLAPAAGFGVLALVTTWCVLAGGSAQLGGLILAGLALAGLLVLVRGRGYIRTGWSRSGQLWLPLVLGSALLVPVWVIELALQGVEVPIWPYDGAFHVETIEALRRHLPWAGWYPPGFHALVAAFLELAPGTDSAFGALQASIGLTLLLQVSAFGFAYVLWRSLLAAAAGALLLALTYHVPYSAHLWATWPLVAGQILTLGLWSAGVCYLHDQRARWVVFGGVLTAAMVLTHGSEIYTAAIGLVLILAGAWRRVRWMRLAQHLGLGLLLALILASPYLPTLQRWTSEGGAVAVASAAMDRPQDRMGLAVDLTFVWPDVLGGYVLDAPARLVLVAVGAWWAFRRGRGRLLVPLGLVFLGLALLCTYVTTDVVQWVFARTWPWSLGYRLLEIVAVVAALLGGGGVAAVSHLHTRRWVRRAFVAGGALVGTAGVLLLPMRLAADGQRQVHYTPDDAAAMDWLRRNARPGEVLANSGVVDAAIWAPYKAGIPILLPDSAALPDAAERLQLLDRAASLDAQAQIHACALHVRYVYRGSTAVTYLDGHRLPSVSELRQSPALEEVFTRGGVSVFAIRAPCSGPRAELTDT